MDEFYIENKTAIQVVLGLMIFMLALGACNLMQDVVDGPQLLTRTATKPGEGMFHQEHESGFFGYNAVEIRTFDGTECLLVHIWAGEDYRESLLWCEG